MPSSAHAAADTRSLFGRPCPGAIALSDIAIRFDGLLFGGAIALCAAFLLIGAVIFAVWRGADKARSARIARACALGLTACLISFAGLIFYLETAGPPPSGPDWLDWLTLPWLAILLGGLARRLRPPAR